MGDKHTGERVFPRAMVHPYKLNDIRQVLDPLDETELGNQKSKIVEILKDNATIVGFLDYETTLIPETNLLNPRQCNLIAKPSEVAFTLWEGFKCPDKLFEREDWEGSHDEKFLFLREFFRADCNSFHFLIKPKQDPDWSPQMTQDFYKEATLDKSNVFNHNCTHLNPLCPQQGEQFINAKGKLEWRPKTICVTYEAFMFIMEFILKEVIAQSGLPDRKALIAIKGGNEEDFINHELKWRGGVVDLEHLYLPTYNQQPINVLSLFRQCGQNFHLNFSDEVGHLSDKTFPWWPKAVWHGKKSGYIHCPLS